MKIMGKAADAEVLSKEIINATRNIFEETNKIRDAKSRLASSMQDEGFDEVEGVIHKVYHSINQNLDDVKLLQKALMAYAEILSRK